MIYNKGECTDCGEHTDYLRKEKLGKEVLILYIQNKTNSIIVYASLDKTFGFFF